MENLPHISNCEVLNPQAVLGAVMPKENMSHSLQEAIANAARKCNPLGHSK